MVRPAHIAALAIALSACVGEIEGTGGGGSTDPTDPGGEPEHVDITGPQVLPHVQAFADAACGAIGACQVSTRDGHHPTGDRAIDVLVSDAFGSVPSDGNALGDAYAEFALEHQAEYGIWYVIWRQRINDGSGWEAMEDRGSITQNHYDHVHLSFEESL